MAVIPAMRRSPTSGSWSGFRRAGSAFRRRSPPSSRSWPPTKRATCRARPTPSMAAEPRLEAQKQQDLPIMPVTLDPDAAAVYKAFLDAGRPAYETVSPAEAREFYLQARFVSNPEPPELKSIEPLAIPSPAASIPARVYTPIKLRKANDLAPCLVFFHGGGWVIGNLDSHDAVCRKLADEGQLIVISIDYRLAPEHKFPAAVNDVVAATTWIADNAKQLGIDASRLMIGGDSAGGNLAAVVAISAHDGNGPAIAGQVLIYPATESARTHPSHREPETSILLTHSVTRYFYESYLNGAADINDWRASPARASTLIGLPPAYVL